MCSKAAAKDENKRCKNSEKLTGCDAHEGVDFLSVWLHLKRRYGNFVAATGDGEVRCLCAVAN